MVINVRPLKLPLVIALLLFGLPWASAAPNATPNPADAKPPKMITLAEAQRLQGLNGVYVIVDDVNVDAAQDGLDKSELLKFIKSRLANSRIPVLTYAQFQKVILLPSIEFAVSTLKNNDGSYFYTITAEFSEIVLSFTAMNTWMNATIWEKGSLGHCSTSELFAQVELAVGGVADRFIEDYQSANPSPVKATP